MARNRRTVARWCIVVMFGLLAPAPLCAQSHVPGIGAAPPVAEPDLGPPLSDFESGVSFIDSALPRSTLRLRFDRNSLNFRPTRAEYLFPGDGFRLPETKVSTQEFDTYVEYGLNQWFSTFMETPFKWVDPEQNRNVYGLGDLHFGAKFAGWNSEALVTAFQLRFGAHTSQHVLTGNGHWSVEPSLLFNWRPTPYLTMEGQVGYWVPLGGTDFAGDILKYGIGLSYGGRNASAIQLMPVAEIVGSTITSGKSTFAQSPGVFLTESASGDTIINGCLGLRFTLGQAGDIYAGYARSFTGQTWYRDMLRVEFRLSY